MRDTKEESKQHSMKPINVTDPKVVSARFHMAFPELGKLFSWLNRGFDAGANWQALLEAHLKIIGARRTLKLANEVLDTLGIGLRTERDVETLVCNVLGLDQAVLIGEGITAVEFLITLRRMLSVAAAA